MKKDQELIVITKTYDLILWSCNHTSKFPRNHRFVLGERIERNLYNLLETLIAAKDQTLVSCGAGRSTINRRTSARRTVTGTPRRTVTLTTVSAPPVLGNRMRILFRRNSRAVLSLGACSQVQVAVPCRVTSVARTNEAQARRVW